VTGPSGGDSPLTSPEAVLAACEAAVRDAVTVNTAVQAQQGAWLDASLPEPFGHGRRRWHPLTPGGGKGARGLYSNSRAGTCRRLVHADDWRGHR
jgi:hypothetical protein